MYNVQGVRVAGGTFPARVWHDFMSVAMLNQEPLDWPKPPEQLTYTILPPPTEEHKDRKDRKPGRPRKPGKPDRNN
jgi:membrane peptidoglycan carboxypeptidase